MDNVGGTLKANKEYTQSFPAVDDFLDDIATEGKSHKKIDHRGRKEFPALNSGKSGGGVVTNNAADGIINEDPNEIKVAIGYMNNFAFSRTSVGEMVPSVIQTSVFRPYHHKCVGDKLVRRYCFAFDPSHVRKARIHQGVWKWLSPCDPARAGDRALLGCQNGRNRDSLAARRKAGRTRLHQPARSLQEYKDPRIQKPGQAPTNEKEFALYALKHATQKLWDPAAHEGGDQFSGWEEFYSTGVWNSDPYPYRKRWGAMKTATGMFEFFSETLKVALEGHAEKHETNVDDILETCNYQARGEQAFIPHYEEPFMVGDDAEYPLVFVDYKSRLNREGRSANATWYQELRDLDPGDEAWDDVAKLNPVDANALGIKSGDRVKISSLTGELECTAKVWEGARPGTVAKAYGQGHWAYGRVASEEFGKTPRGGEQQCK